MKTLAEIMILTVLVFILVDLVSIQVPVTHAIPSPKAISRPDRTAQGEKLAEMVDARVEFFRKAQKTSIGPVMCRDLETWFAQMPGKVETFLDWQYSFSTKLGSTFNSIRDAGNWLNETVWGLVGTPIPETPNHNRAMVIKAFEEKVVSQAELEQILQKSGEAFESALQKECIQFMTQVNHDLSQALERDMSIRLPAARIAGEFANVLQCSIKTMHPLKMTGELVLSMYLSGVAGDMAGAAVGQRIGTWLASNWLRSIAMTGKMASWMGIVAAPAGGMTGAGLAAGATSLGVGILAAWAIDSLFEWWSRPEARKEILGALKKLEINLMNGDAGTEGLRKIGERRIDEVAASLKSLYRRAIRNILSIS